MRRLLLPDLAGGDQRILDFSETRTNGQQVIAEKALLLGGSNLNFGADSCHRKNRRCQRHRFKSVRPSFEVPGGLFASAGPRSFVARNRLAFETCSQRPGHLFVLFHQTYKKAARAMVAVFLAAGLQIAAQLPDDRLMVS